MEKCTKRKKKHLEGEIMNGERVPDMQLGKCRYVRLHDNVNYVAAGIILRGEGPETGGCFLIRSCQKRLLRKWIMPADVFEEAKMRTLLNERYERSPVMNVM
ncbi:hypothetical protein OSTOST_20044 [Ostertagia ostertagi]